MRALFLLGEPRLEVDGQTTATAAPREPALCWRGWCCSLASRFRARIWLLRSWSDTSEPRALANLRRHLYLIRNLLPPPAQGSSVIAPQTVSLAGVSACLGGCGRVRAGRREPGSAGTRAAGVVSGRADDRHRGDEFLIARREALRGRFLTVLKKLAQGHAERGDPARALDWTRRLLLEDPWDEEAVRLKMRLEAQSGNRAAALATYQTLARDLERELDARPVPETMALYSDILSQPPGAPVPCRQKPAAPAFISREAELERLARLCSSGLLARTRDGWCSSLARPGSARRRSWRRKPCAVWRKDMGQAAPRVLWGAWSPPLLAESPPRPYAAWTQILNAAAPPPGAQRDRFGLNG